MISQGTRTFILKMQKQQKFFRSQLPPPHPVVPALGSPNGLGACKMKSGKSYIFHNLCQAYNIYLMNGGDLFYTLRLHLSKIEI